MRRSDDTFLVLLQYQVHIQKGKTRVLKVEIYSVNLARCCLVAMCQSLKCRHQEFDADVALYLLCRSMAGVALAVDL